MPNAGYLKVEPADPNKPIDPKLAEEIFQAARKESIIPVDRNSENADVYVCIGAQTFHLLSVNLHDLGELLRKFS